MYSNLPIKIGPMVQLGPLLRMRVLRQFLGKGQGIITSRRFYCRRAGHSRRLNSLGDVAVVMLVQGRISRSIVAIQQGVHVKSWKLPSGWESKWDTYRVTGALGVVAPEVMELVTRLRLVAGPRFHYGGWVKDEA